MEHIIIAAIFLPAILSLVVGVYSMLRFLVSRRGATASNDLIVGALGVLSILFPKLMSEQSRRHFRRFLLSMGFFAIYCLGLMVVFKGVETIS